jgi:hypothetical protein
MPISLRIPSRPNVVRGLMQERRNVLNCLALLREIVGSQPEKDGDDHEPDHRIQKEDKDQTQLGCACNSPHLNAPNHQVIATVVEAEICVFILRTVEWTAVSVRRDFAQHNQPIRSTKIRQHAHFIRKLVTVIHQGTPEAR